MHRLVGSGNEGLGVYPRIREWAWVVKTYKACLGLPKVNLTYETVEKVLTAHFCYFRIK